MSIAPGEIRTALAGDREWLERPEWTVPTDGAAEEVAMVRLERWMEEGRGWCGTLTVSDGVEVSGIDLDLDGMESVAAALTAAAARLRELSSS